MRFQIALATAFLASNVMGSPFPYVQTDSHNEKYNVAKDPKQAPTYLGKDISVTDYEYCDNGRKWWKKWTVSHGGKAGQNKPMPTKELSPNKPAPISDNSSKPIELPKPQHLPLPPSYDIPKPKPSPPKYDVPKPQPEPPTYDAPKPQPEPPTYDTPKPQPEPPTYDTPKPQPEPPTYDTPKPPKSDDFIQSILDAHNTVRAKHNSPPLVWDQKLADYAVDFCDKCVFEHSHGPYGENLSAGSLIVPADSVQSWYKEISLYDFNSPGFSMSTGHFTQVIWKATTKVGCGIKSDCSNMPKGPYLFACEYEVAGNVQSQFPQNVLSIGGSAPSPQPDQSYGGYESY